MASSDDARRASYVNSGSVLLKDMLREKKAQKQRQTNGQRNGLDNRNIQSSPIASMSMRNEEGASGRRSSGSGMKNGSGPKEMGLREMEEHISQIKKQNFDLKLELFHRRRRNEELEAKLANIPILEADNAELQSINEELLLELEKRDIAIQEAVDQICDLEGKIEEMGEAETYFMRNTKIPEPDLSTQCDSVGTKAPDVFLEISSQSEEPQAQAQPRSSPPPLNASSPTPSKPARRVPSFLRDMNKSTTVLRSLYLNDNCQGQGNRSSLSVARPGSLYSGEDDDEDPMLNSPRLSVLSESGFSSIYGSRKRSHSPPQNHNTHVDGQLLPNNRPSQNNQREARLQKWLVERDRPTTPAQQTPNAAFSSIGQVLEDMPGVGKVQAPEAPQYDEQKSRRERSSERSLRKKPRTRQRRPSSPTFGGPVFGGGILPPTPDTLSTTTTAASSSTPSIVTEKSLLDGRPDPVKGFSALGPDARPHTSDSNIASTFGTALVYTQVSRLNRSKEEQGSPHSIQSNASFGNHLHESARVSPSRHSSTRSSTRPIRPALTTSATETIFNANGSSPTQVSRTLSYPSPGGRTRDPSNQQSPMSSKGLNLLYEKTPNASPRNKGSATNATVTPSRLTRSMHQRSPTANRELATPTSFSTGIDSQSEASQSTARASSLRSRMASISLTPSKSAHQSIASRLFRRSNSQSIQNSPSDQTSIPSIPPVAHARLPRPSSLYIPSPTNGQKPFPEPPAEEDPIYELPTYQLASMLPEARPGTAGNDHVAAKGSLLPLHIRRHSAALDHGADIWSKEKSESNYQGRETESRQTVRTEDGKKWALGRSASAKIREGLGFKRSISTQNV